MILQRKSTEVRKCKLGISLYQFSALIVQGAVVITFSGASARNADSRVFGFSLIFVFFFLFRGCCGLVLGFFFLGLFSFLLTLKFQTAS